MDITEFRRLMKEQTPVIAGSELMNMFHQLSQEALKITSEINNKYHTPDDLRKLFQN